MADSFDPNPWYKPERDGDLKTYITHKTMRSIPPLFRGLETYEMLCRNGYVQIGITTVRVMGEMVEDHCYGVVEDYKLAGISFGHFSGRQGTHDAKEILKENPMFEMQDLKIDLEAVEI